MRTRFGWLLPLVLVGTLPVVSWSQDDKKAEPPAAKADDAKKTDEAKSDEPAPAGPAAAKFAATYEQWKELLKQLRTIRTKYQAADDAKAPALKKQWDEVIAKADGMLPELRKDAIGAYEESPNLDSTITRLLVKLLHEDVASDNYDQGAALADSLIKNGCDLMQIYRDAGIIAFVNNDYENADKYLKTAEAAKALDPIGKNYLELVPEYTKLWAAEKAVREKEAAADDLPRVKFETSKGPIVIELFENEAPQTVGNFISLVEKGTYDGTIFHRVLPGFMAQGGDPKGDGTGGPGYTIFCECYEKDHRNHFRGTLSMAHAGKDTGGSQFFLTFVPTPHLNGAHTAFGRVVEGMDLLAKLQRVDPMQPKLAASPDKIIKATVVRKRDHDYVPTKVTE